MGSHFKAEDDDDIKVGSGLTLLVQYTTISLSNSSNRLNMSYQMHPGPLNNTVLFLHNQHRALEVFKRPEDYREPMMIKRSDCSFWSDIKDHPIGARVESKIRQAGFGVFSTVGISTLTTR